MSDGMFCYVGLCVTDHVMHIFRCLWWLCLVRCLVWWPSCWMSCAMLRLFMWWHVECCGMSCGMAYHVIVRLHLMAYQMHCNVKSDDILFYDGSYDMSRGMVYHVFVKWHLMTCWIHCHVMSDNIFFFCMLCHDVQCHVKW